MIPGLENAEFARLGVMHRNTFLNSPGFLDDTYRAVSYTHLSIQVIGGGLAGCEAAWQIARRGVPVDLYEMKPCLKTPAQHLDTMAELVCSNSLRSDRLSNAVGLLKAEMRMLDSLIMRAADENAVPAGGALAVDRVGFSAAVDKAVREHPLITVHEQLSLIHISCGCEKGRHDV